ncbi:unnamed protein product [Pylaiella littoralis]
MAYSVLWPLRRLQPAEEATVDLLRSTAWAGATSAPARASFVRALGLPCSSDRLPQPRPPAGTTGATDHSLTLPRDCLAKRQHRMASWAAEHRARRAAAATSAAAAAAAATAAPLPQQDTPQDKDRSGGRRSPSPGVPASAPPSPSVAISSSSSSSSSGSRAPLSIWTDLPHLSDERTGLTRPEFRVLDCRVGAASPRDADVVWASSSINPEFEAAMGGLRPGQMVNQFPYETALVVKTHLARTIQREFGSGSPEGDPMQLTFDMQSQDDSLAFVAEFRRRRDAGMDNV